MKKIENQTILVVFLGDFNPSIFQPIWFAKNKLLSDIEAEKAQIKVVIPDISDFTTDWFSLQVTRDRFLIKTSQESHFDALNDLVIGAFTLLKYTPLKKMGINFEGNIKMNDVESWHACGDKLAPKDIWKKKLMNPGLNQLQIKSERNDDYKGYILVTVNPSLNVENGVNFNINDHYEIDDNNKYMDSSFIIDIFKREK